MTVCNCHGVIFLDCPNYLASREHWPAVPPASDPPAPRCEAIWAKEPDSRCRLPQGHSGAHVSRNWTWTSGQAETSAGTMSSGALRYESEILHKTYPIPPTPARELARQIKEKIHFYLGSDSLGDCWGQVEPLLDSYGLSRFDAGKLSALKWVYLMETNQNTAKAIDEAIRSLKENKT